MDAAEKMSVLVASEELTTVYFGNILIFAAIYFTFPFEIEPIFLALAKLEELIEEGSQQFFVPTDKQ